MDKAERFKTDPRNRNATGQWGKWKGKFCNADDCEKHVICRGLCASHYNKVKWASGNRPPSVNRRSHRTAHLKHRYGITAEEYERILGEQHGACAVCGRLPTPGVNIPKHWIGLCVDHCHDTGKIRGLLCNECNLAVGYGGTEENLIRAARYVGFHNK